MYTPSIESKITWKINNRVNIVGLKIDEKQPNPRYFFIKAYDPNILPQYNEYFAYDEWLPVLLSLSKRVQCFWLKISDLVKEMEFDRRMLIEKHRQGIKAVTHFIQTRIQVHKKLLQAGLKHFEILNIHAFLKKINFLPGIYFSKHHKHPYKITFIERIYQFPFSITVTNKNVFISLKGTRGYIQDGSSKIIKKAINFKTAETYARVRTGTILKNLISAGEDAIQDEVILNFEKEIYYHQKFQCIPQIATILFPYDIKKKNTGYLMEYYKMDLLSFIAYFHTSINSIDLYIHLIKQIALGVASLHNNYCIHGDIKPENILVDYGDRYDYRLSIAITDLEGILDFSKDPQMSLTSYQGTLNYMPPEILLENIEEFDCSYCQELIQMKLKQFENKQNNTFELGKKFDLWSLGVTFYYLINGHLPNFLNYIGNTLESRINYDRSQQTSHGYYPPLKLVTKKDYLDLMIWKLLNPNPADRPTIKHVLSFIDRLSDFESY